MIIRIPRFWNKEMTKWPKNDALYILYFEMVLMSLFLLMNAADFNLQQINAAHYTKAGAFPISQYIAPFLSGLSETVLIIVERSAWWTHIIGIFIFLNYLYYSKHLHILLAFPNTFYANLDAKGKFPNNKTVTDEVKLMLDPNADPYAMPEEPVEGAVIEKFGASDVTDLNWVQLMNAYTCTECGRCSSVCPANLTGKELSPRNIMMKTRDRLEEVGKNIDKNGEFKNDNKQLLNDYITPEELWACTTCNACVEECPINIDPLSIIMEMRQFLVMEQSAAPQELNMMMTNIENNGAPWQYNQMDRLNWKDED
jgi:heterodisulfide reductase subunit C